MITVNKVKPIINASIYSLIALASTVIYNYASAETLRLSSINIGAGQKGTNYQNQCKFSEFGQDVDLTIIGLRRYFGKLAVDADNANVDEMVFALQEVDKNTTRSNGWDMPIYFKDKLNTYMDNNGIVDWSWAEHFSGVSYQGGEYGKVMLSSKSPRKTKTIDHIVTGDPYNTQFQSMKLSVGNEWFWLINVHTTAASPELAANQLQEVVDYANTLDSVPNIVVTGDFNIYRDGLHRTICPEGCSDHLAAYQQMDELFTLNGFQEIGAFEGPCWENGLCSFKASGADYSRLDYAYILKRNPNINTNLLIDRPFVDDNCLITDHYGLNVDLTWQ